MTFATVRTYLSPMRKNPWAVKMAKLRAKKLGPERCRESALLASQAAARARTAKAEERRAAEAQAEEPEAVSA